MEALPIFLDRITTPVLAILISVTGVLFFGEVIPQSLCSRFSLAIGANSTWLVKALMFLLFPVSWPVSKLLDKILGHDKSTYYRRAELKELVSIHGAAASLTVDECTIIKGALDMKSKIVSDCMTPLKSVFMLPIESKLDVDTILNIIQEGHSRIPIFKGNKQNIVGVLSVKNLIGLDPQEAKPLTEIKLPSIPSIKGNTPLYDMLNEFQTGKTHMVTVIDEKSKELLGVVTLSDVFEELIQEEIVDETDVYVDVEKRIRVAKALSSKHDISTMPTIEDFDSKFPLL